MPLSQLFASGPVTASTRRSGSGTAMTAPGAAGVSTTLGGLLGEQRVDRSVLEHHVSRGLALRCQRQLEARRTVRVHQAANATLGHPLSGLPHDAGDLLAG